MDQNKKDNELMPDTDAEEISDAASVEETAEESAAQNSDGGDQDLKEELEQIRDMFQQELDKATSEAETGETDGDSEAGESLIQPLEDMDPANPHQDEDAEEAPKRICECCGESACSEDYGEDYPFCDACRELMKRYPLRISGIIMCIIMAALFVATVFVSADYAEGFMTVGQGASYYDKGKVTSALSVYYSYLSSADPDTVSKKALHDTIDAYVSNGYMSDAASLINTYYDEDALKLPWNKRYQKILDRTTILTESYYAIADIIEGPMTGEDYDYDEIMAQLDALKTANPKEEGKSEITEKYSEVFIEFYRYLVMNIHDESPETQLEQLKKVDELGEKDMEWAYLASYCALAARCSDEKLTREIFDRMLKNNAEDSGAYNAMAMYYRYLEKPDADKMLELSDQAKENAYSGDVSYLMTSAIAYLLKGDYETALDNMESYINTMGYSVQSCNLYALCGLAAGDDTVYDEMKKLLEDSGYEISDLVVQYKQGKMTIEEVITDKGGDI